MTNHTYADYPSDHQSTKIQKFPKLKSFQETHCLSTTLFQYLMMSAAPGVQKYTALWCSICVTMPKASGGGTVMRQIHTHETYRRGGIVLYIHIQHGQTTITDTGLITIRNGMEDQAQIRRNSLLRREEGKKDWSGKSGSDPEDLEQYQDSITGCRQDTIQRGCIAIMTS